MRKSLFLILLFLILGPFSPLHAYYGEEGSEDGVRDYERLQLLKQATGGGSSEPSSASYFETRVDAMFNPAAQSTPTFDSQAREDAAATQEVQAREKIDSLQTEKNTERSRKAALGSLPKNDNGLAGTNLAGELQMKPNTDQFKDKTSYVNASEENFQALAEKRLQQENEPESAFEDPLTQQKKKKKKEEPGERPTLANNPYYFAGNVAQTRATNFETNKPLILSRMIQNAIPANEAENILIRSSTQEEVIMALMEDYGKPYGIAKEITDTAKKKS